MAASTLNFNIGVLGHIDSGKTTLAKILSTTASTASFDKNPQSKERGITLDLGFSSFCVDIPEHLKFTNCDKLQFTLVDCPGHASLIKTIIGGSQIIDLMMLVVDVTKGMQTQTAEGLILGEITCEKMVVVLNKIDLLTPEKCQATVDKMTKRMLKTLETTKFANSTVIAVAAKPGGPDAPETIESMGIEGLITSLCQAAYLPKRDPGGPFIFAIDHCFSIRGQGTVMTGTVLKGKVSINDNVEIPFMKVVKKVKSIQVFHQPVESAIQGSRVGLCVTQFDPKLLERGLVCSPGALPTIYAAIITVKKISYFKSKCSSKCKFHLSMGHETVMGRIKFFGHPGPVSEISDPHTFDFSREYIYQDELMGDISKMENKYEEPANVVCSQQFALIELERPVTCVPLGLVIGSRLDTDIHSNICRLAFHGILLEPIQDKQYSETVLPNLKIYKMKKKEGLVERMVDRYTVIAKSLFKKETNIQLFVNLKVSLSTGEKGFVEGSFGQSGKIKLRIPEGLQDSTAALLSDVKKPKGKNKEKDTPTPADKNIDTTDHKNISVILLFKRYVHDLQKRIIQT